MTAQRLDLELVQSALRRCQAWLASERHDGHWTGQLSTSALSTATAIVALHQVDAAKATRTHDATITAGAAWLIDHQNADGGWGDTSRSRSNISTTTLCWAALHVCGDGAARATAVTRAGDWLRQAAGDLSPEALTQAITARYGRDRTFAVPIVMHCAVCGVLGEGDAGWWRVLALPFELAVLPQRFFRFVRLPVVSYALPALIAIGYARYVKGPPRNPLVRGLRRWAARGALRRLQSIQPSGGGFLEAAPLTSFVTMSLAAAGQSGHRVVVEGVRFLERSVLADGSWPIDTNLATWVTTLAVNAGACDDDRADELGAVPDPVPWLLAQQGLQRHPYTGADPGGWAWTDLPGGVPDADDTAGALLALHRLAAADPDVQRAARAGLLWLMGLQNRDGGIPTFCHGWGHLPFDRSGPDLTAHALRAMAVWRPVFEDPGLRRRLDCATQRGIRYLVRSQRADGTWLPLWFGNEAVANDENPVYGTARVLMGLAPLAGSPAVDSMAARATDGLSSAINEDGTWGGDATVRVGSIEETAVAVDALALWRGAHDPIVVRGGMALAQRILATHDVPDATPIGFYFARLWYFERLYPVAFSAAALATLTSTCSKRSAMATDENSR